MKRMTIALVVTALVGCGTSETKSNNNASTNNTSTNNTSTNNTSTNNTSTNNTSTNNTSTNNTSTNNTSTNNSSSNNSTIVPPKEHRAVAEQCDNERDPGLVGGTPTGQECSDDSECTDGDNGRCVQGRITECTYDLCFNDGECGADEVCLCGVGLGANYCLPGNCRTDSDCGDNGFCSPSQGDCGNYFGTIGFFCHTPEDECKDDSDCGADFNSSCRFDPGLSHWACSESQCVG